MSRLLMHISDLHFGRVPEGMADRLAATANEIAPHVIVVSGDLTQRARIAEFEAARAFLDRLSYPLIVIPGNHDVPLYNPYGRFVERLARFRRYITDDLAPAFIDEEVAIVGVNTARSLTWKGGRINARQIAAVRTELCGVPREVTRVIATHHPHGVAKLALRQWSTCGADLLLCGHLHVAAAECIGRTLVINAGTAISTRGRGQANSFNVVEIVDRERVSVTQWAWNGSGFAKLEAAQFARTETGWARSMSR